MNPKRIFSFAVLIPLALISSIFLFLPTQNKYSYGLYNESVTESFKPLNPPSPFPYPINATGQQSPELTAHGVVAIDIHSGVVLFEKNSEVRFPPASTTKVMTAVVALDLWDLDEVIEVGDPHIEGQVMGLVKGEKITVENLLYGMLIHSANDAAYALANHHPQGIEGFMLAMNEKAAQLHLKNTHFKNPAGFDDLDHYISPKDLANLSLFALDNKVINKMVGISQITISDIDFVHFHQLKNVNQLLGVIPGLSGLKTGWTQEAGECLVSTVSRDNKSILTVILGSEDRFTETKILISWVYDNFTWKDHLELSTQ